MRTTKGQLENVNTAELDRIAAFIEEIKAERALAAFAENTSALSEQGSEQHVSERSIRILTEKVDPSPALSCQLKWRNEEK